MCAFGQGSIRAALGTTLGVLGTSKTKENERFYGFTEFRGKPAGRGREGRGSLNQDIAGGTRAAQSGDTETSSSTDRTVTREYLERRERGESRDEHSERAVLQL